MNYYLFEGDFPYYALVVANNEEDAIEEYINVVSDLDENDGEFPIEVDKEFAIAEVEKSYIENELDKFEIIKMIRNDEFTEKEVVLISLDLI